VKLRAVVGITLVVAMIATACGGDETSSVDGVGTDGGQAQTSVVVAAPLEPPTLDPTESSAAAIPEVLLYNVLETLVKLSDDGELEPLLAESYEQSDDGLTYTFHLREATFHDGSPLTAADVVFTFDRARAEDSAHPFKAHFDPVASVEATDERTVTVTLSSFSNNWLFNMSQGAGVILSEATIGQVAEHPVGTGPFEFATWNRGDSIELARYDGYWGDAPALQDVVFRYIEDATATNQALLAGDVDIISRVSGPELLEQFEGNAQFEVIDGLTNGETILAMNNASAVLADVRVRQAITHAIDRGALIDATYAGYGTRIGSHVPPTDPWYLDLTDLYPYDPDRARTLLAEAGVAEGTSLKMTLPPPSYARRGGEFIQGQLAEVGLQVEIENVEFPQWLESTFQASDFDLTIISHVEPRDIVQYGNPDYYWNYDNPDVATKLEQADAAPDTATRDQLYAEVQRTISETDVVNVWLFVLPNLAVVNSGISGYPTNKVSFSIDMTGVSYTM